MTEDNKKEKFKLPKSTKSGWCIHEMANAFGVFYASEFKFEPEDVTSGRETLTDFLENIDKPNLNIEGQGELTDDEMKKFIKNALDQEWTPENLKRLYKGFMELREKVNN